MTLQQLKYLAELSKHDSISQAAAALFVTQPSISKAIRDLEKEFHITILSRTNRGILFTSAGTELLFYAKVLLEQAESVQYHFNPQNADRPPRFSISSQHFGFAVEALNRLIASLGRRSYELMLREGKSTDVIEDVFTGRSLLGILSYNDLARGFFERSFSTNSLDFVSLQSFRQSVYLRREHPLARRAFITHDQLKAFPYVTYQQDDVPLYFSESDLVSSKGAQRIYVKDRGTMNEVLAYTDAYNVGTGCITSRYMNPDIVSVPLHEGHRIQVGYVVQHEALLPKEIRLYLEDLEDSLKNSVPR